LDAERQELRSRDPKAIASYSANASLQMTLSSSFDNDLNGADIAVLLQRDE